jgi:membrane fusion protein (multidrug efflux system)
VNIQARVTGYLAAQIFTDGQTVQAGQPLYVIEQAPYAALVAQAKAALAQAQAQEKNAELTLRRAQSLLHTAAGAQATVDQAMADAQSDQAAIAGAQAALQTAQINYGYTSITAPIDGVIGATSVNPGNVVGPASGVLATIVSTDPMYVTFSLPEADAEKDRPEAVNVLLQLPDGTMYPAAGHVDFVNNQVDAATDTLTWRATIANPARRLSDGETVTVFLQARNATKLVVIPLTALIADQLGDYVLDVGPDGRVVRRAVTLGQQDAASVAILSGVQPGDKVIVQGLQKIQPGMAVNAKPVAGS